MSFTRFRSGSSFKRFSQPATTDPYDTTSIDHQISNAETRIVDAGYKPENTDKRNWFEKATNLPKGQNFFFDTLELLGRPGQAVMNAVHKKNTNMGLGEALKRGVSGEDRVRGSDLLDNTNIRNPVAKAIVGTGLEIALDPLTYVPGGVLAKGVSIPAKATGRAIGGAVRAAENAIPSFARFNENVVRPAAENVKDGVGYMFNRNYKIDETLSGGKNDFLKNLEQTTDNSRRFMQEDTLGNLGKAARDAGGIDTGADVGRILEAPLRQFDDVKMYELPDGVRRTTSKRELKNEAIGNHQRIKELGQNVREVRRDLDGQISQAGQRLDKLDRGIQKMFFSAERKKLKTLQKTDPKSLNKPKLLRGFAPNSPALNVLMKRGDEIKEQIASARAELGLPRVRKKSYTPEQMQGLATQRAFKQLSPSPAFNVLLKQRDEMKVSLDELREVRKTAGVQEIADIQKLVDDTGVLKEAAKNPVMVQREIPRPLRDMPTDPKIQQSAKKLIESNAAVRQFAEQNGIDIPELEGYMTHVWSKAERDFKKRQKPALVDRGSFGKGNPNKSILNERTLKGSAEDINERLVKTGARPEGHIHTEPNAFYASAIGQKRLIDYVHAVKFRREVLSNQEFAKPFKMGMDVPNGAEVIDTTNYKFLKESGDILGDTKLADEVGGQYIVTKQAKMLLDRYQHLNTDEGTKAFLKFYDGIQSFWKRSALFSIGYHMRNQAGAMFNNYVGGMNIYNGDLAKYTQQGFREVARSLGGKESALFSEYRKQGLSSTSLSQVEFARYGEEPEKAIERTVKKLSKDTKGQITQRLNPLNAFETSREVGDFFDQANRFALYKWAREKKGMTAEQAAAKVSEVQFDYSKTTPFEQNVVTRVVPFYRWMKNNIPFQIRKFINDPRKYQYLNKARLNAQDAVGLDDENIPDYMKESFTVPVYGANGKGRMLGLNLPLGDLTKLSSPGRTLIDAATPLIKTPAELALNYNIFRGKPIKQFAGQEKKYNVPGVGEFGVPIEAAYAFEQSTGQIGRGLSGMLQKPESVDQDNVNRLPSLGISSLTKSFDAEKYSYYEKLNQLKQLQDLIRFIEQQTGEKPRLVREIQKGQ